MPVRHNETMAQRTEPATADELAQRFAAAAEAFSLLARAERALTACTPEEGGPHEGCAEFALPVSDEAWAAFDEAYEAWGVAAGVAQERTERATAAAQTFFDTLALIAFAGMLRNKLQARFNPSGVIGGCGELLADEWRSGTTENN